MAYIAKSTVLTAYQLLSNIDKDKNQGLTQKVSALKYGAALDMYFKNNQANCDLKLSTNKDTFASYVGQIVKINDTQCTKDFYISIAQNGRDFDCGSNFYSQSSVKDSRTNTTETFKYPKRSGWQSVMSIKNQVLIYRKDLIKSSIDYYLPSPLYRLAFVIWILRFENISTQDMEGLKKALFQLFTKEYCDALFPNENENVDSIQIEYAESKCELTETDINNIFQNSKKNIPIEDLSHQQIFYGAPGTGKSHCIKEMTEGKQVIRTTFHPDSDYSTFVGAYKPTTIEVEMRDVTGKIIVENGEKVTEKRIVYEFVEQAFLQAYTKAWREYAKAITAGKNPEEIFLVIEEINRGNCAQIFGDLFQLLDRGDDGFSEYPIVADIDLQKQLRKAFNNVDIQNVPAVGGMSVEETAERIKNGEILLLPSNLYVWATMNTSDQSLFPIDSAFKRRWDWQYMPISDSKNGWLIEANGKRYDWWQFLQKINEQIDVATHSEDKKLGYYFCKAKNGIISAETFVGKVIFYLWNDVFKDFADEAGAVFQDADGSTLSFNKFYTIDDNGKTKVAEDKVELFLRHLGIDFMEDNAEEDDEEDMDTSSTSQRDYSRYKLNGNGKYGKAEVVIEAVKKYVNDHSEESAETIAESWKELANVTPPIIETNSAYTSRKSQTSDPNFDKRSKELRLPNGESIYVRKGYNPQLITEFINEINKKPWGVHIEKIEE